MEEPGGLQSMGSWRVGHDWATSLSLFTFMHWRRKWQPTSVFLPGESQGRGSLVFCRLWGRTESDTTEATQQQQQQHWLPLGIQPLTSVSRGNSCLRLMISLSTHVVINTWNWFGCLQCLLKQEAFFPTWYCFKDFSTHIHVAGLRYQTTKLLPVTWIYLRFSIHLLFIASKMNLKTLLLKRKLQSAHLYTVPYADMLGCLQFIEKNLSRGENYGL